MHSDQKKDSPARKVVKGAAYLGGAQFMRILVRAIYIVVLARFLGPELFGLYNYGLSWYLAFMSLTFMGFDLILGREGSQRGAQSDAFIAATLRVQLFVSTTAALLSGSVGLLLEQWDVSLILGIFSLALLGRSVSSWASFVFAARQTSSRVFWMESVCRVLEAVVGSIVLVFGGGLLEVVVIHAVFWWVQATWGLIEISAKQLLLIPNSINDVVSKLGWTPIILGVAGVAQVWLAQAPLLLFRVMGGDDVSMGQLALALQIFGLFAGLSWTACRAVLPELSESVREGRSGDARFVTLLGQLTIIGVGAVTAVTYVLGAPLLELLVGQEYALAGDYLPYVVAASAAYTLGVGGHQILASHRAYAAILWGTVPAAAVLSGMMLVIWEWSPQYAPFISLAAGLFVWILLIGRAVYARTAFSVRKVILVPLLVSITGVVVARLLLPYSGIMALMATVAWFAVWVWYLNPLKSKARPIAED